MIFSLTHGLFIAVFFLFSYFFLLKYSCYPVFQVYSTVIQICSYACVYVRVCMCTQFLSHVQLYAIPWTVAAPGSSVHGFFQARILEWVAIVLLQGIFPTHGSNLHLLCLLHWQVDSLSLGHLGSPIYIHTHIYIYMYMHTFSDYFPL